MITKITLKILLALTPKIERSTVKISRSWLKKIYSLDQTPQSVVQIFHLFYSGNIVIVYVYLKNSPIIAYFVVTSALLSHTFCALPNRLNFRSSTSMSLHNVFLISTTWLKAKLDVTVFITYISMQFDLNFIFMSY